MKRLILAAVFGGFGVFAPLSLGAATTSLPSCTTAQLVPNISELAVDQGLPTYARLARGKEALVRAYLTTPTGCALTRSESITPTSATLTFNGTTYNNVDPLSGAVSGAQQISAASDPYFDIPASALTPTDTAAFNATFTVQVTYKWTNGTATGTATTPATATNASKTVPVDQKINAIRVLVVPIGDPTSTTTQFSSSANLAVQQQMTAVDRVFPVETGTADLRSASGGVRYTINGGLLDAASLGLFTQGKFCSNATNYASSLVTSGAFAGLTLKGQLQQALADYNRVNTAAPADVVLGAVDEGISWQSLSTSPLCPAAAGFAAGAPDDGRASTPAAGVLGQPAWARITYSGAPSPVVMELAHNLGISRCCTSFHSTNVSADVTAPNHAMNVLQKKVLYTGGTLGASHSAMNYNTTSVPLTANNQVFEPGDWADMLCDLGGVQSLTGGCALSTSAGTSTGVAANFSINGTTDGTDARVTNSYAASIDGGLQTADVTSTTHVRFFNGTSCDSPGTLLKDFGLPVTSDEGHGPAGAEDDGGLSGFHGLVAMPSGATVVQLTVNGNVKYCRAPQGTPDVTGTNVGPADLGALLTSFAMPGGGVNGRAIAYDSDRKSLWATFADNTHVEELSTSGSLLRTVDLSKSVGSLSYDTTGKQLYGGNLTSGGGADDGSVYQISTGATPAITSLISKFDLSADPTCRGGAPGALDGLAYFPSSNSFAISGDAARVAHLAMRDGEFWSLGAPFTVAAANSDCNSGIARDGNGGAWYALVGDAGSDTTTFVHRATPDGTVDMSFQAPQYEAEDIDYDPVTFAPQCALWANEATLSTPQIRAYSVPCNGAQPSGQKAITFTATGDNLVGTAYVTCGDNSPKYPVADSLTPTATEEAVSTFTFAFSPTLSCAGGSTAKLITSVSDGIHVSALDDPQAATTIDSSQKPPVATINAPTANQTYGLGAKITLNGSGFDYTDGALSGSQLVWKIDGSSAGTGTSPADVPATSGDHAVALTVTDSAGQSDTATVTIHVDGTPPVLTLTPGVTANTENVVASDNATGDSGLANIFCSANSSFATLSPAFAAGPTYSGSFSYSAATIQQLSCTAYDKAGNQTTVNTVSQYAPVGQLCGGSPGKTALQPVNPDGSSVFKKGSAVPVKFTVCDGTGPVGPSSVVDTARTPPPAIPASFGGGTCSVTGATTAGVPVLCRVSAGAGSVDESVYSNTPDTAFRFSSPQWVFNLSTSNLTAGRTYLYYVPLNDDTNIFLQFALK